MNIAATDLVAALRLTDEMTLPEALENATGQEVDIEEAFTFVQAGLMTNSEGLVLRLSDGTEFQLTVVQSRGAR